MFTIRFWSDASISTSKSVSNLQITSEQCDDKVHTGLPTNASFIIGDSSLLIECLYGNQGACQIYVETTTLIMLNTENINTRRRLSAGSRYCCGTPDEGCGKCHEGFYWDCLKGVDGFYSYCCGTNQEGCRKCIDGYGWTCLRVVNKACLPAQTIVNILYIGAILLLFEYS